MAREAILEMDCSRYSEKIIDIIMLFHEVGWKYYNIEKEIEYLPIGDIDDYDWQKEVLSEEQLRELVNNKQDNSERVGINLYYQNSDEGLSLLAQNTKEIIIDLCINRKTIDNTRDSITDISWYFDNIIRKLKEKRCSIDYIKFIDYTD